MGVFKFPPPLALAKTANTYYTVKLFGYSAL